MRALALAVMLSAFFPKLNAVHEPLIFWIPNEPSSLAARLAHNVHPFNINEHVELVGPNGDSATEGHVVELERNRIRRFFIPDEPVHLKSLVVGIDLFAPSVSEGDNHAKGGIFEDGGGSSIIPETCKERHAVGIDEGSVFEIDWIEIRDFQSGERLFSGFSGSHGSGHIIFGYGKGCLVSVPRIFALPLGFEPEPLGRQPQSSGEARYGETSERTYQAAMTIQQSSGANGLTADEATDDEAFLLCIAMALGGGFLTYALLKRWYDRVFSPHEDDKRDDRRHKN